LGAEAGEDAMMNLDEDNKPPLKEIVVGADLSALSVAELEARIAALKGEIARVERDIAGKRSSRTAADSVFKF
jgi:uncharacterized small protein (DUF1192 family)